jgi:DNA polymerase III subunit delta
MVFASELAATEAAPWMPWSRDVSRVVAHGKNFELAANQAGVWASKQPLFRAASQRLKSAQLQLLLRKANGIDKAVKGMRNAQPWDELLDLLLNMAGINSLNATNERLTLKI